MNELKIEDVERIIGRIILANYQNEQNMIAQLESMNQQLEAAKTQAPKVSS